MSGSSVTGDGADPFVVPVTPAPLSAQQQRWVEAAWARITPERARALDVELVDCWSYTGHERAIAELLVARLGDAGVTAGVQPIDPTSANALARLGEPRGDGASLLLMAPTDTHFRGDEADGLQWGDPPRRDNRRPAVVEPDGQTVVGLGSDNPKACVTAIVLALEALAQAGVPLRGELQAALVAGGAPARTEPGEERRNLSLGAGARHLVHHGLAADYAVYHKPGYGVSWEDHALNQFRIRVQGKPTYLRMGGSYRVVDQAAQVVLAFNRWAREVYRHQPVGTFRPMAALNVAHMGRPDKPNWSPGVAELHADVRTAPGTRPIDARRLFDRLMAEICADIPGIDAHWELVAHMPGGRTDPSSWIVQAAIRGWQAVEGDRSATYRGEPAGQTEMGLLQTLGIPSVKLHGTGTNPPHPTLPDDLSEYTLSAAHAPTMAKAAKILVHLAVDTLTRPRGEVGLDE